MEKCVGTYVYRGRSVRHCRSFERVTINQRLKSIGISLIWRRVEEEEGVLKKNDESKTHSRFLPAIAVRERAGLLMRLRAFRVCPAQSVLPGYADKFPRDVRRRLSER
jgi:hypothetical protein